MLLVIAGAISCKPKPSNTSKVAFAETLLYALETRDFKAMEVLYILPEDRYLKEDVTYLGEAANSRWTELDEKMGTDELHNQYSKQREAHFFNALKVGESIGVNWDDVEYKDCSFELDQGWNVRNFNIHFNSNGSDFSMNVGRLDEINNGYKCFTFSPPITGEKLLSPIAKRKPSLGSLQFTDINHLWKHKTKDSMELSDFLFSIKNTSDNEIDHLKYRVELGYLLNGDSTSLCTADKECFAFVYPGEYHRVSLRDSKLAKNPLALPSASNLYWRLEQLSF